MTSLLVRYTSIGEEFDSQAHQYFAKADKRCVIVEEVGANGAKHFHAALTAVSQAAVAKWLSRNGWSDAAKKSVKQGAANYQYLCKGPGAISKIKDPRYPGKKDPPIVVYNGAGVDASAEHEAWWRDAQVWVATKEQNKEKKKKEKGRLRDLMFAWYEENEASLLHHCLSARKTIICRQALEMVRELGPTSVYDVKKVTLWLLCRGASHDLDAMAQEMMERW